MEGRRIINIILLIVLLFIVYIFFKGTIGNDNSEIIEESKKDSVPVTTIVTKVDDIKNDDIIDLTVE